jgi:hypothetical protein
MSQIANMFEGFVKGFSFGQPYKVTIASGVATIPAGERSFIRLESESSTTDTLDTITKADAEVGDFLLLEAFPGHTITVDDANIDLTAATVALTDVGQYLGLIYNGAGWSECFKALGDNS